MKKAIRLLCIAVLCALIFSFAVYAVWDFFMPIKKTLIDEGNNFKVYRYVDNDAWYKYEIYNSDGKLVRGPDGIDGQHRITQTDKLLAIHVGSETAGFDHYYDIRHDRFLERYFSPIQLNDLLLYVAQSNNGLVLVLQKIYDEGVFYCEYALDLSPVTAAPAPVEPAPVTPGPTPITYEDKTALVDASFINEHQIEVTYLSGSDYSETTAIIDLPA